MPPRNPVVEWLLCIFVPFYSALLYPPVEQGDRGLSSGRIDYNPTSTLLALTLGAFIIVPPFVAMASFCGRIREARRMAGLPQTTGFWGFIGRAILISLRLQVDRRTQLNEIGTRPPQY